MLSDLYYQMVLSLLYLLSHTLLCEKSAKMMRILCQKTHLTHRPPLSEELASLRKLFRIPENSSLSSALVCFKCLSFPRMFRLPFDTMISICCRTIKCNGAFNNIFCVLLGISWSCPLLVTMFTIQTEVLLNIQVYYVLLFDCTHELTVYMSVQLYARHT